MSSESSYALRLSLGDSIRNVDSCRPYTPFVTKENIPDHDFQIYLCASFSGKAQRYPQNAVVHFNIPSGDANVLGLYLLVRKTTICTGFPLQRIQT